MSFTFVFYRALVLTFIVTFFLIASWPNARKSSVLAGAIFGVLMVNALWLFLPSLPAPAGWLGRWVVTAWIDTVVAATLLAIPLAFALIGRRLLGHRMRLTNFVALTYVCSALAVGLAISVTTVSGPVIRESAITISGLPAELDGLRIANVGDVHIGRFIAPSDLSAAIEMINNSNVDLLAVTGDLIDDLDQLAPTLDAIERSHAQPVLSILGNHDKYPNQSAIVSALKERNPRIKVLVNSSAIVYPRGVPLRIAGSDYPLAQDGRHITPREEQNAMMANFAKEAFAEASPGETMIALSHHPEFFPFAAVNGAMLTLSSHTHGGQVALFGHPLIVAYDYMHGIHERDGRFLDVTSGLGHWLPLRLGVPREVSIVTLRRG